jgi:hypothetical protein
LKQWRIRILVQTALWPGRVSGLLQKESRSLGPGGFKKKLPANEERAQWLFAGNPDGHALNDAERDRIQAYMQKYLTKAVSEDGLIAYTLVGEKLVTCDPDALEAESD